MLFAINTYSQADIRYLHEVVKTAKSDTTLIRAYLHLATFYSNNIGDSAVYYSNQALDLLKKTPNKKMEAWAFRNLANGYFSMQDYNETARQLFKSIKLYEELKDTIEIACTYQFAGSVLYEISSEEKSLSYLYKAMALAQYKKSEEILASIYNDFSYIFNAKGNYDSSLVYQIKAYEIDKLSQAKDQEELLASDEHNIGAIYFHLENYEKAEEFLKSAYSRRQKLGYKLQILSSLNVLNAIAIKQKNYVKALEITHIASSLAHEIKSTRERIIVYQRYRLIYHYINKHDLAHKYGDSSIIALNQLNDEEATRISNETEAKFQNEKKELENKELKNQNDLSEKIIKQQKTVFYVIIIALAISLLLMYFVYKGLKNQRTANKIIEKQKLDVEVKNKIIEEKQKEILDSIHYAKRIQNTLLAHKEFLENNLPEHFIFFKPKDIVSGDFYWATVANGNFYLAVCDSTGHGVPGAFMSLLNIGFLTEAINEKGIYKPNEIFDFVRNRLIGSVSKEGQQDGYDGILICFNKSSNEITYAAANNAPILISDKTLKELASDRMPVGKGSSENPFQLFSMNYKAGDTLYLYTDGFADQFGGAKGKKYKYRQLNDLLLRVSDQVCSKQSEVLENEFTQWRGNLEQVDDVLIIGIRLS